MAVGIPRSLAEAGVRKEEFEAALPDLARAAFEDPSLRTNPRMPLYASSKSSSVRVGTAANGRNVNVRYRCSETRPHPMAGTLSRSQNRVAMGLGDLP